MITKQSTRTQGVHFIDLSISTYRTHQRAPYELLLLRCWLLNIGIRRHLELECSSRSRNSRYSRLPCSQYLMTILRCSSQFLRHVTKWFLVWGFLTPHISWTRSFRVGGVRHRKFPEGMAWRLEINRNKNMDEIYLPTGCESRRNAFSLHTCVNEELGLQIFEVWHTIHKKR